MDQAELLEIIHHAAQTKQTGLDLCGKGLTELPAELWQLTNLTVLDLSENQLTAVPPKLGQLTATHQFSLTNRSLFLLVWSARAVKQKYTTPEGLSKLMTHHQVEASSQCVLVRWLHELGEILFFQDNDDLNDIVIFKPQWVTEHISRVLEAEEVIRLNGTFTRTCMNC